MLRFLARLEMTSYFCYAVLRFHSAYLLRPCFVAQAEMRAMASGS